jgi:hypothetical protein
MEVIFQNSDSHEPNTVTIVRASFWLNSGAYMAAARASEHLQIVRVLREQERVEPLEWDWVGGWVGGGYAEMTYLSPHSTL